jgi:predicted AAA+ superfamily ATPase
MRYLYPTVNEFASRKMVLLAGPRQCGKTTLAKAWLKEHKGSYLNWDIPEDRAKVLSKKFMADHASGFLVLDEFHKYSRWKSWLKGLYDRNSPELKILVTGSARLDIFQRGGDSLLGRYELLHLHPYTIGEIIHQSCVAPPKSWMKLKTERNSLDTTWNRLETFSGFPEPYHTANKLHYNRWATRRRELLLREDIRELTQIRQISLVEHLALLLPERVGSLLSINSIREEIQVAHDTASQWIEILERLYYCFRIRPYHKKISRGLKKEQKLYLWNWAEVQDSSARFENMVASHLLKSVQLWTDLGFGSFELCYVRNKEKVEVDFLIVRDSKPWVLIEVKEADTTPSSSLKILGDQLSPEVERLQLVRHHDYDKVVGATRIVSASRLLTGLS